MKASGKNEIKVYLNTAEIRGCYRVSRRYTISIHDVKSAGNVTVTVEH